MTGGLSKRELYRDAAKPGFSKTSTGGRLQDGLTARIVKLKPPEILSLLRDLTEISSSRAGAHEFAKELAIAEVPSMLRHADITRSLQSQRSLLFCLQISLFPNGCLQSRRTVEIESQLHLMQGFLQEQLDTSMQENSRQKHAGREPPHAARRLRVDSAEVRFKLQRIQICPSLFLVGPVLCIRLTAVDVGILDLGGRNEIVQ